MALADIKRRNRASETEVQAWGEDALRDRDQADLISTVALSLNASESMAVAARITGDTMSIRDSLETSSAAVLQMERSVDMITENSAETTRTVAGAVDMMRENLTRMEETNTTSANSVDALKQAEVQTATLIDGVKEIEGFVGAIGDIAGKTNMLAINASIEAARAGEAGRGFAVVASQVQALSSQTQQVTESITKLIASISGAVDGVNGSMTEVAGSVGRTAELAAAAAADMTTMAGDLERARESVAEVNEALGEQSIAAVAISVNINTISNDSQASARRTEQLIRAVSESEQHIARRFAELDTRAASIQDYVLHRAKSDHFLWKKNLSEMLVGMNSLTEAELADHHSCRLGKWYDQVDDPTIRNHPAYAALEAPHASVHAHGKAAAKAYAADNLELAVHEIDQMEKASAEVVRLLDTLIAR